MSEVTLVEVAPRDGFQVVKPFIPTEAKIEVIEALAKAGFQRMEIGAYVSPKAIPQMADIGDILDRATLPQDMRLQVLVPNGKGVERALDAGISEISWVVSISDSHNQNNVRRSVAQSMNDFENVWHTHGERVSVLRFNLATAFDCPFEGRTDEAAVVAVLERVLQNASRVEFGICDTTGRAANDHVESFTRTLVDRYASEDVTFAFHGHDTYNLGVANALAAYRAGVHVFDGAAAGLGGCPFAPGASGNTATEDLAFAFEHMGIATGIDIDQLLTAADLAYGVAPDQSAGRLRSVPRHRVLSGFGRNARGIPASAAAE
ncbi:MAG: hydroxymethylglutaryl-CoA lyase [Hyphomicrobiaceae bacterium]